MPMHNSSQETETLVQPPARKNAPKPVTGAIAALAAAALMAGYVVLGKQLISAGSAPADPGVFWITRQLIAAILMVIIALMQHGYQMPEPQDRMGLAALGVLNFINGVGFMWGVKLTTAFITSVMQLSIPVFTLVYSACSGLEHASLGKAAGVLVVVAGCMLVTVGGAHAGEAAGEEQLSASLVPFGVGVLVVQCTSFVGLVLVQKPLVARYPVSWVIAWSYVLCTVWSCVVALLDGSIFHVSVMFSSTRSLAILIYSATFGCVLYFALIAYASKHLSATLVSVTVSLEPLVVSVIGSIFFEYRPQALELWGYVVALLGSILLARATREVSAQPVDQELLHLQGEDLHRGDWQQPQSA